MQNNQLRPQQPSAKSDNIHTDYQGLPKIAL
jgi:hypothetical protein